MVKYALVGPVLAFSKVPFLNYIDKNWPVQRRDLLRGRLVVGRDDSADRGPPVLVHGHEDVVGVLAPHVLKEAVDSVWGSKLQAFLDAGL